MIAGQVVLARSRALTVLLALPPSSTCPTSMVKRVMFVVITAVAGAPRNEIRTSPFCTAIAETPSMPPRIMIVVFGSKARRRAAAKGEKRCQQQELNQKQRHERRDLKPLQTSGQQFS